MPGWTDVEFTEFGVGSYVLDPASRNPETGVFDPTYNRITIEKYIAGVVWKEIGKTWAAGAPPSLREGFIAQAVAARSNLAHYNRLNDRTGANSFEFARLPPPTQAYEALPASGEASEYITAIVADAFSANIMILDGQRVFAPFGAKLDPPDATGNTRTMTRDSDVARGQADEPLEGVLKNRSSIGFFNCGFKDNPSISREIFGVRLLKRRKAVLGDPPQGLFQQSHFAC
jgi:hypothetical protein